MRNGEILLDVVGEVSEDLIPDVSEEKNPIRLRRQIGRIVALGGICAACILFVVMIGWMALDGKNADRDMNDRQENKGGGSMGYFNGEVLENTEEYILIKPIAEWDWDYEVTVRISTTQVRSDYQPFEIRTPLSRGDISELKAGDMVRVAFNSNQMVWSDDEVFLEIVFMLFRILEDGTVK